MTEEINFLYHNDSYNRNNEIKKMNLVNWLMSSFSIS